MINDKILKINIVIFVLVDGRVEKSVHKTIDDDMIIIMSEAGEQNTHLCETPKDWKKVLQQWRTASYHF